VRNKESEHLIAKESPYHEDVPCSEIVLFLLSHPEIDIAVEIEWNGFAFKDLEGIRPVKQSHVDASTVRTIIVDYLEIGIFDLRLIDKILKDVPVLDFADAEDCMINFVVFLHRADDSSHVLKLFRILHLSPVVGSIRKVLVIVLSVIMICVKEVLEIVEPYDIALPRKDNSLII